MPQSSLFSVSVPGPPQAGAYHVLYLDPPWPEHGGGQVQRGADRHYPLMPVKDIQRLPFGEWAAADAHCYCWLTNNYLEAGFAAVRGWGFRPVTLVTWVKDRAGLGQYFRGRTEHCLFAVRGRLPYRIAPDGKRAQGETVLFHPDPDVEELPEPAQLPRAFEATRTRHSAKPPEMRAFVELVSPGPYLECFARIAPAGWDVWGNEAPVPDAQPSGEL
jgi:N6-adenosine-specific RNA methylase IME4